MININDDGSCLIIGETLPTESDFIKAADVEKDSYSECLIRRIYDHIFGGIVDVKREYQVYYSKEYSDIMSFLYWKYDIDERILRSNKTKIQSSQFVGFAYSASDGDNHLSYMLRSNAGRELLQSLLNRIKKRKKRK